MDTGGSAWSSPSRRAPAPVAVSVVPAGVGSLFTNDSCESLCSDLALIDGEFVLANGEGVVDNGEGIEPGID